MLQLPKEVIENISHPSFEVIKQVTPLAQVLSHDFFHVFLLFPSLFRDDCQKRGYYQSPKILFQMLCQLSPPILFSAPIPAIHPMNPQNLILGYFPA